MSRPACLNGCSTRLLLRFAVGVKQLRLMFEAARDKPSGLHPTSMRVAGVACRLPLVAGKTHVALDFPFCSRFKTFWSF